MSIVINTNVSSILVQRSLQQSTGSIGQSLQKLSTGYRINKAADDAAGLTISESLKSQARGAQVAANNAQTGVNLLQTAEGDLSIIQDNLQRIRDLAVQAANGTNGTAERAAIQSEVQQRIDEIDRIASASSFNSIKLLDGTSSSLSLQIGTKSTPSLNSISITSGTINPLGNANASSLGIGSISSAFASASAAASFISSVDTAISSVSEKRSTIGSLQNRLESAITSLNVQFENMSASESRIRDVDVAKEAAALTKNQILQQASATLLAQANQAPAVALSLI
ncbi:MAG: flagellin [Candidatus Melainabacteria bacterium GWF2_37_15]|nr:MAG: flagellin [Candidatus Melainabacteria bacterium GWF2_37_15]